MKPSDVAIIIALSTECRINEYDTDSEQVSYGEGTGDSDGACEDEYVDDNLGVYDPFPGTNTDYPMFNVVDLPGAFPGDDFESYSHNGIIASSSSHASHIDVTSGVLYAKHLNGSQVWKRGFTDSSVFRMLAVGIYDGLPVRYQDGTASIRVYFSAIHANAPFYHGAHIFQRYQTEYDLYVASLRLDGKVAIKKKVCGQYTTLAQAEFSGGSVTTGEWYDIEFEASGTDLNLYVDGNLELSVTDTDLSWGTTGIRLDYADVYLDDWTFTD